MKQWSFALILALSFVLAQLPAQIPAVAQTGADRNAEERYRILTSKVDSLLESYESMMRSQQELKSRLDTLEREISRSKEDSAKSNMQTVTREEVKSIWEKLQEIERKREADKALILKSIGELKKIPIATPNDSKGNSKTDDSERYKYTVKAGENLNAIIAVYNEIFKGEGRLLIKNADVIKANPGLNPDLIREGQVIEIPIPAKKR